MKEFAVYTQVLTTYVKFVSAESEEKAIAIAKETDPLTDDGWEIEEILDPGEDNFWVYESEDDEGEEDDEEEGE